jgi:hypothetical protein
MATPCCTSTGAVAFTIAMDSADNSRICASP